MEERDRTVQPDEFEPGALSLRGFHAIGAVSTFLGILIVFVLNLATPLGFVFDRTAYLLQLDVAELIPIILAVVAVVVASCAMALLVVHIILRPVSECLGRLRRNRDPGSALEDRARRRLLNLPFLFIPASLALWILIPAVVFVLFYTLRIVDLRTGLVFAVRAGMVGFVASAIGFFALESHSRKNLIPFFFPKGRLADVKGVARISISRRIRMFYRLGSLVPLAILIITLLTLQMEVDPSAISAEDYGIGIIRFAVTLSLVFFFASGVLNRMVSRSIVTPINYMLDNIERIRDGDYGSRIKVVGNDEIGVLGDAGNAMIRGLAERHHLRNTFGRYVTPEIRDEILSGRIPLQGERREATVMFADLRGFTRYVEIHPPEEVIADMRSYFTAMHRAIRRHGGLVLQFVGDEIETVFGVPVHIEDHADAAVRAALEMKKALEDLNRGRAARGKDPFEHGIGIHSGLVLAGNSGSEDQSAYSLIGDPVNVASRIQGLTKEIGCDMLVSRDTVDCLKDRYELDELPPRTVKGYSRPITVFRILGAKQKI